MIAGAVDATSLWATHRNLESGPDPITKYVGVEKDLVPQVFSYACRCKASIPHVDEVIKTVLEKEVVLALMDAACRTLPPDNAPKGREFRLQRQRARAEKAQLAEDAFIRHLERLPVSFKREQEQKARALAHGSTLRFNLYVCFTDPITLCGHPCKWIEDKHYSGFPRTHSSRSKESGRSRDIWSI